MTIKCAQCGNDNPDDSNFCEWCGAKLEGAAPPAPLVAPPAPPAPPAILYKLSFRGNVWEVSESAKTFGRHDFARYLPEDEYKYISRAHFTITKEDDRFFIRDEGSANGTKLNGKEIRGAGKCELHDGDRINVADTVEVTFNIVR